MKATELKKKYPKIWNNIYKGMIADLLTYMTGADIQQYKEKNKDCRIITIAYNAAFLGCYEVHKMLTSKILVEQLIDKE